jgi:hypothetical protein
VCALSFVIEFPYYFFVFPTFIRSWHLFFISLFVYLVFLSLVFSIFNLSYFVSVLSLFWNNKYMLMRSPCCLCIPSVNFWTAEPILIKFDMYVYHDNWTNFKGVLHESYSSVCVSTCVSLLLLLAHSYDLCSFLSIIYVFIHLFVLRMYVFILYFLVSFLFCICLSYLPFILPPFSYYVWILHFINLFILFIYEFSFMLLSLFLSFFPSFFLSFWYTF